MSSEIDTSPIISVVKWQDNLCAVGFTNFMVRVDPRGMAAVLTVDPDASFVERYAHFYGVKPAILRAKVPGWTEALGTLDGYRQFYDYCAHNLRYETSEIVEGVTNGFWYEVVCRKDSPLVGWFLVLGVENG